MKASKKRKLIQVPSKCSKGKIRREGLDEIVDTCKKDLATEIYETGMLMGLIPAQNKENLCRKSKIDYLDRVDLNQQPKSQFKAANGEYFTSELEYPWF